jgi:hypothetical protein
MVMADQLFYKGLCGSVEDLDILSFVEQIPKLTEQLVFDKESKRELTNFFGTIFSISKWPSQ